MGRVLAQGQAPRAVNPNVPAHTESLTSFPALGLELHSRCIKISQKAGESRCQQGSSEGRKDGSEGSSQPGLASPS